MGNAGQAKSPFQRTRPFTQPAKLSRALKLYRLRWKRRRFLVRSLRKRSELLPEQDRTTGIKRTDTLLFVTVRNEEERLPYFLDYYRRLGIDHFLFVDNASTDGTGELLRRQDDVSLWSTDQSYRLSRFGVDWLTALQFRYGGGHWCLTVDADELLVYPDCETRGLADLTTEMERVGQTALGAVMLDMFPRRSISEVVYQSGEDPIESLPWFDANGYRTQIHQTYENEWIQGGVRDRYFFASDPSRAPTLNKFPLVKWNRRYAYVNSTHQILPVKLHQFLDLDTQKHVSGALLHTKFLPSIMEKSLEELVRKQHFQNSDLYQNYHQTLAEGPDLWVETAQKYTNSHLLVELGLISKGQLPEN